MVHFDPKPYGDDFNPTSQHYIITNHAEHSTILGGFAVFIERQMPVPVLPKRTFNETNDEGHFFAPYSPKGKGECDK